MLQFKRQWLLLDYGIMGFMLKIGYGGACKMKQKAQLEYATDVREIQRSRFIPEVVNVFDDFLYY